MKTFIALLFLSTCFAAEIKDGKITELQKKTLLLVNTQMRLLDMQYKEQRADLAQQLNAAIHEACAGVKEEDIGRCSIDTDKMTFHVADAPKPPEPPKPAPDEKKKP